MTTPKPNYEQVLAEFSRDPTNPKFKEIFSIITYALTPLGSKEPRIHIVRDTLNQNRGLKQSVISGVELREAANRKARHDNGEKLAEREKKMGKLIDMQRELGIIPNRGLAYKPPTRRKIQKPRPL